jgi:hypothetical protein
MIARLPGYAEALSLGRSNRGILLDAGCCCGPFFNLPKCGRLRTCYAVGLDTRKAVLDGWPVNRIVATDLVPGEY